MRTLFEIVELAKSGGKPEYEEILYALLALDALGTFDRSDVRNLCKALGDSPRAKLTLEEGFRRMKAALGKDPKAWVGWNNDPRNPAYLERRRMALRIADKAMKEYPPENLKAYAENPVDPSNFGELEITERDPRAQVHAHLAAAARILSDIALCDSAPRERGLAESAEDALRYAEEMGWGKICPECGKSLQPSVGVSFEGALGCGRCGYTRRMEERDDGG